MPTKAPAKKPAAKTVAVKVEKKPQAVRTDKQVTVTLTKSLLGRPDKHRKVAKALGLTKSHQTVTHYDSRTIRGMITKISHLLTIQQPV